MEEIQKIIEEGRCIDVKGFTIDNINEIDKVVKIFLNTVDPFKLKDFPDYLKYFKNIC